MNFFKKKFLILFSLTISLLLSQATSMLSLAQENTKVIATNNNIATDFNLLKESNLPVEEFTIKSLVFAKLSLEKNAFIETDSILSYCLNNTNLNTSSPLRINLLFLKGKLEIKKGNSENALTCLSQSLDQSIALSDFELLGEIYNNIGVVYWHQRNYPQALDFFDKALDAAVKQMDEDLRLKALTNKGIVYGQIANYTKAIECLLLSNELAFNSNNKNIEASSLNSLGNIYLQTQQLQKALEAYTNAKAIFASIGDSTGISICLNNIGEIYLFQNNTAFALENYFNSLSIQEKKKDTIKIATIYINIGNTHYKSGQYRYAIKYFQNALRLLENKPDKSLDAEIRYHLGLTLMAKGNYTQAEEYLKQAALISEKINEKEVQAKSTLALSEIYEKQALYKKALRFKNEYATIKDSILNDKSIEYMARMDAIYRSIKKGKIIQNLTAEKRIREQVLLREKNSRMVFLVTSLFLAMLTIILFAAFYFKRRSSKNMKEVNKKLQQLNATKDKFFSIISHDLKSPINSILGFSEMLVLHAETKSTKSLLEFGQMIHSSSKKLYALVDNLLLWSRTQVGATRYSPEAVDISIQCNNIISLLRLSSEEKDILISGKIEKGIMAYADINLFNTILRNLISNAIKFSRVGGSIIVSAKRSDQFVEISIADSGVGISQDNLEKLFKIDSNISTKGTFNEKGSGLGLILCKEFVEINKGTIWAESELERGSTFYFTVPLAKE